MTTTQTDTTTTTDAAPGGRLATGAALLAAGVALEWVLSPQQGDGTVIHPVRFALCAGTSAVGTGLLIWALRELRGSLPRTRATRFGRVTSLVGAALLLVAMVAILGSGLVTGTPAGASFIPWALGILALTVGPVVLGIGLLRRVPTLGVPCLVAGLAAFASVVIPIDPWHDVALMVMCGSWAVAGLALRQAAVASRRSRL